MPPGAPRIPHLANPPRGLAQTPGPALREPAAGSSPQGASRRPACCSRRRRSPWPSRPYRRRPRRLHRPPPRGSWSQRPPPPRVWPGFPGAPASAGATYRSAAGSGARTPGPAPLRAEREGPGRPAPLPSSPPARGSGSRSPFSARAGCGGGGTGTQRRLGLPGAAAAAATAVASVPSLQGRGGRTHNPARARGTAKRGRATFAKERRSGRHRSPPEEPPVSLRAATFHIPPPPFHEQGGRGSSTKL